METSKRVLQYGKKVRHTIFTTDGFRRTFGSLLFSILLYSDLVYLVCGFDRIHGHISNRILWEDIKYAGIPLTCVSV